MGKLLFGLMADIYQVSAINCAAVYAGHIKAHTIMNANKALVLYILFCNKMIQLKLSY